MLIILNSTAIDLLRIKSNQMSLCSDFAGFATVEMIQTSANQTEISYHDACHFYANSFTNITPCVCVYYTFDITQRSKYVERSLYPWVLTNVTMHNIGWYLYVHHRCRYLLRGWNCPVLSDLSYKSPVHHSTRSWNLPRDDTFP